MKLAFGCNNGFKGHKTIVCGSNPQIPPGIVIDLDMQDEGNTLHDKSGYGNNGTVHGNIVNTEATNGKNCKQSDGSHGSYISVLMDYIPQLYKISIETIFELDNIPFSGMVFNKDSSFRILAADVNESRLSVRYATSATRWLVGTFTGNTTLESNRLYHAILTLDGEKIRTYLDGELDHEQDETGNIDASPWPLQLLGTDAYGGVAGKLYSFRMWNRGLSQKEATNLFKIFKKEYGGV